MNKYINIVLIFIALMIVFPIHSQNVKCEILDNVIKEYDKSKGVCANFNIQTEGNGYVSVVDGKIFLKGWIFAFNTEEMECGYDGKTLWTYIKNNEEIIHKNSDISCYILSDRLPLSKFQEAIATGKMVL